MSVRWQVQLLGGLVVRQADAAGSGGEMRFETRKAAALFAYLAYHLGRSVPRDPLAEHIWPGEDLDPIRDRFRQALAALKRTLEPTGVEPGSVLMADRQEVRLNPDMVHTDVAALSLLLRSSARDDSSLMEQQTTLSQAAVLYHGELLAGFYDDWIFPERTRLAQQHHEICSQLAILLAVSGQTVESLNYAQRAVLTDPGREDSQGLLMRLYVAVGRRPDALRQYRELEQALQEDGITPSEEIRRLSAFLQTCSPAEALNGLPLPRVSRQHTQENFFRTSVPSLDITPESTTTVKPISLEPDGGAVPLDSPFYIERAPDAAFHEAVRRQDSIVLVKGPRLIGKTSLLARGLRQVRQESTEKPVRVVLTDFQKLTEEQLESPDTLFFTLSEAIVERLDLDISVEALWNPARNWNVNFERFLRRTILGTTDAPLVWGLDEVDRLFAYRYRSEVFGLFRAWHNERALDPESPWARLTLAISYATEAHLFITDLNQSPFNVGTRLVLEDFTLTEVSELNRRYGTPLLDTTLLKRFYDLVGGHPYLQRRGLRAMAEGERKIAQLEAEADREDGVYSDHLLRLLSVLRQDPLLSDAVRAMLSGSGAMSVDAFYRLRSAGVVIGASPAEARCRCELYRRFLKRRLP